MHYYLKDSLLLPEEIGTTAFGSQIRYSDSGRITYLDKERNLFLLYDINSGRNTDSFVFEEDIQALEIRNFDSVYIAGRHELITIFRKKIRRYDLSEMLRTYVDANVWISDGNGFSVVDDTVRITVRWFSDKDDTIPSRRSVLTHFEVVFALKGDSVMYLGKYNPDPVALVGQDFGTNMSRPALLLNGHMIVCNLPFWDTLYTYDVIRRQEHKIGIHSSIRPAPQPFDYSKATDHAYFSGYHNANAWFTFLYHDPWRNHVYQFLKHPGDYITSDGERKKYYDAPFSLLVYSQDLQLQRELFIPPKTLYPLKMFTTPSGLYIAEDKDVRQFPGKTVFYRFIIP
ncbi:MAG: hypothetical protein QM743_05505 [Chitinophagaceae bacterium]